MIPDRGEVGKVRTEDVIDLPIPACRIIVVIEIAGMDHGVCPLILN